MHLCVQTSSYELLGCGRPVWEYGRVCAQLFNKVSTGFLVGKQNNLI